jgi:uncharacterized protein (TIGR02996 family)
MADDEAFMAAIRASPDDDWLRLVYADWLEERGDPRGEFIRVQLALARLPEHEERWAELAAREQDLLQRHQAKWARPFEPFTYRRVFRRGLVEAVELHDPCHYPRGLDFLGCLAAVTALAPVQEISWPACPGDLERLAASPLLATQSAIDPTPGGIFNVCGRGGPGAGSLLPGLQVLAASRHAAGLRSLRVAWKFYGDTLVRLVALAPCLTALQCLDLSGEDLTDAGLDLLVDSPLGRRLCRLNCAHNPALTSAAVSRLFGSEGLPGLTSLDVDVSGWGADGVGPLLFANRLCTLTRLSLIHGTPDWIDGIARTEVRSLAGLGELFRSEAMPRLTELVLTGIELTPADLQILATGPLGRQLHALTLERCLLNDHDVPLLLPLLGTGRLRRLALPYNMLSDEVARLLASCPGLSCLRALDLADNNLTSAGVQMLAASPYCQP